MPNRPLLKTWMLPLCLLLAACGSSPDAATEDAAQTAVAAASQDNSTPYKLAETLLEALKANDKAVWVKYIDPKSESRDAILKQFDQLRAEAPGHGLIDWDKVKYSRTTYTNAFMGQQHDDGVARSVRIEFTYGDEFLGVIGSFGAFSKRNNAYYIWSQPDGITMGRKGVGF